jgi:hypothetical protein
MDWFPGRYFPNSAAAFKPYALLLLNQPIAAHPFSSLHETGALTPSLLPYYVHVKFILSDW